MSFNKQKHIRYWRMCANILPDAYQSSDASRMFLGFFIVAALDLLDVLNNPDLEKPIISAEERQNWIDWIYSCQVSDREGFRGFTGTNLTDRRNKDNKQWDPSNLPNTFFALIALLVLGDDLARVQRQKCLSWLPRLQRPDGSFGEILGPNDEIEGGRDLRYCCCAAGIAYILHDPAGKPYRPVFNEERLIDYILSCQDYNGGYGESPLREPHSGLNYCAIGTLELLSRLPGPASQRAKDALGCQDGCIRWLLERQTTVLYEEDPDADDGEEEEEVAAAAPSFANSPMYYSEPTTTAGFNGRDNKIADTCYCFWNTGALAMLRSLHLADLPAVRRYLLEKVQHMIGGFAKGPDSPPGESAPLPAIVL
ncbi:geranylgeranyl transferase type-1 subunit beta [Knufia obscura]|uniref:Geranylgeranyl transferase type-1 subunit beta n=2 Tax=Knufia TaxID=430999 RepID=A0AAN8E9T7_9EURO|nr:geranylgeranyl transferase type-1 subunit beta [Knufia obscura]KAK5948715.1 geranylgeranyl transferase type-1 subunit beta [Knufia fluminis]